MLAKEFRATVSKEIQRLYSEIDKRVGNYQTTSNYRAKLRLQNFALIELEESLRTKNELSVRSDIAEINKMAVHPTLSIKLNFQKDLTKQDLDFKLTRKEIEILNLLPSGLSISAMARKSFLTESTIKTHLSAIYRKLGVSNRVQAISVARENNLLTF
jgi:DNA-binding NarL/FixJ family response regulator